LASISSQKGRLYLLATLPHKDGSPGRKQARITLKLDDTAQNWRVARKRLELLEREIAKGTFEWSDWVDTHGKVSWRHAIDLLYRKKVLNGRTSQSSWDVRVMGYLRQQDQSEQVTTESLQRFVTKYKREQAAYKQAYYLARDIAKLVEASFPELGVPLYGRAEILKVPTDAEIIDWVLQSGQPYQWAFGTIATYGLRPSELAGCEFDGERLIVKEDTKTGSRIVVPLYREWVQLFDLLNVQELPKSQRVQPRPDEIAQWLHKRKDKMGIKWKTYSLRHSYAGRLWREGGSKLDIYLAARLMGHTAAEHTKTYRQWISPHTIADKAEEVLYSSGSNAVE
jgi:integrase